MIPWIIEETGSLLLSMMILTLTFGLVTHDVTHAVFLCSLVPIPHPCVTRTTGFRMLPSPSFRQFSYFGKFSLAPTLHLPKLIRWRPNTKMCIRPPKILYTCTVGYPASQRHLWVTRASGEGPCAIVLKREPARRLQTTKNINTFSLWIKTKRKPLSENCSISMIFLHMINYSCWQAPMLEGCISISTG